MDAPDQERAVVRRVVSVWGTCRALALTTVRRVIGWRRVGSSVSSDYVPLGSAILSRGALAEAIATGTGKATSDPHTPHMDA